MSLIKNFDTLAITPERKIVLQLIEAGLRAIQPKQELQKSFSLQGNVLTIANQTFDLTAFDRIFLIGFGKGSGGIVKIVETTLGDKLTDGYDIDNVQESFPRVHFTLGTHPLPSQQNIDFTKHVLQNINNLTERDLVLVVICGGGSAMFEVPFAADLTTIDSIDKQLLNSGATIAEMNVIRKHLSTVKGGGLAKHLYPAKVVSLIFSDVPGNDTAVIASGPTTHDQSTMDDVQLILKTYHIPVDATLFNETPTDQKYFLNVSNIIMVSNQTALQAMHEKAKELGYESIIFSDKLQGDARKLGEKLIAATKPHSILLAGGETTVVVKGKGKGGRNQTFVLASLPFVGKDTTVAAFDSDGIDYYYFAGAIGDNHTVTKAKELHLDPATYLHDDNTYEFLEKVGDGIDTGKLDSNVSDLFIVAKI